MQLKYLSFIVLAFVAIAKADLKADMKDFQKLIPKARLAVLFGARYIFDSDFQKSYTYLKSEEFKLIHNEMVNTPEVQNIINYLGVSKNLVLDNVNSITLPYVSIEELVNERTFSSFFVKAMGYISNSDVRSMIRQRNASSPEFARLYAKTMDPSFKNLVLTAIQSQNLSGAVKELKDHNIDLNYLMNVIFNKLNEWKVYEFRQTQIK